MQQWFELAGTRNQLTGTFFCDSTTAQSLPRTPIAMMLAAVMALKAYSVTLSCQHKVGSWDSLPAKGPEAEC